MESEIITIWLAQHPAWGPWALAAGLAISGAVVFWIARYLIANVLVYLAKRTANKYDDIIVEKLRPFRFAWIAPLLLVYRFAGLLPQVAEPLRGAVLFVMLWLVIVTLRSLLDGVNAIYEASPFYRGESIQTYTDLASIILVLVGIIVSISMLTGKSPLVLLSGLGAITAVLLLVFQETILSFVAGMRIQSSDLVREGDALEVPSYDADGEVTNISLHAIRIQNWDKTITVIPTHKLVEVPYKNYRGILDSGARRIKRALHLDVSSVRFCDAELIEHLKKIDLIQDYMQAELAELEQWNREHNVNPDDPVNARQLVNLEAFRAYVVRYLKSRPDIRQDGLTLVARPLDPGPAGLPLEIYAFTKTPDWEEYEAIQADIFSHLLAAVPQFGLCVFQEPSGMDLQGLMARPGTSASGLK
jgi:miniconductance mechanosensitive channel